MAKKEQKDIKGKVLTKEPIHFIRLVNGAEFFAPVKEKKGKFYIFRPMEIFQHIMNGIPVFNLNVYISKDFIENEWIEINKEFILINEVASKNIVDFFWKMVAVYDYASEKIGKQIKEMKKNGKKAKSTNPLLPPKEQRFIDLNDPKYKDVSEKVMEEIDEEKEALVEGNKGKKSILKN